MPGGRGNRYMYYATGQPGWMRFGYSPGWVGRSATGLGPCAEYITTGKWPTPQMQAAWESGVVPPAGVATGAPQITPEEELDMLKNQARILKQQLDQIEKRIKDWEKKKK